MFALITASMLTKKPVISPMMSQSKGIVSLSPRRSYHSFQRQESRVKLAISRLYSSGSGPKLNIQTSGILLDGYLLELNIQRRPISYSRRLYCHKHCRHCSVPSLSTYENGHNTSMRTSTSLGEKRSVPAIFTSFLVSYLDA